LYFRNPYTIIQGMIKRWINKKLTSGIANTPAVALTPNNNYLISQNDGKNYTNNTIKLIGSLQFS